MDQNHEHLKMVEGLLFAAKEPLSLADMAERLPKDVAIEQHLATLKQNYQGRGVELAEAGGKWFFRTAGDLAFLLRQEVEQERRLSRAAIETLAIIAYHQPVTRAEIEDIRGVAISKGTLDILMEAGWVRPKGRRQTPGKPVTYGTSDEFLVHFGIESLKDLPGFEELKAAGLLDSVDDALSRLERETRLRIDAEEGEEAPSPEDEESLFPDDEEETPDDAETSEDEPESL
jgi:segregation and condensation protein B